jgi:hypothetical protein
MAHYLILDENNFVIGGHVGRDEDDIVLDEKGEPIDWEKYYNAKRTSYNTRGGVHYKTGTMIPSEDQTKAFRKNYAGIGYTYDEERDAFIPPKLYSSWVLDEFSCLWVSPIPYPSITNIPQEFQIYNKYFWNEINHYWELKKPFNNWILHGNMYYMSPVPHPNDNGIYIWNEETQIWDLINS